jgi:hypothetical protein
MRPKCPGVRKGAPTGYSGIIAVTVARSFAIDESKRERQARRHGPAAEWIAGG